MGLAGLLIPALALAAPAAPPRSRDAQRLFESAQRHLDLETFDARRTAIRELEEATLISPNRPDWDLLLARTYMRCGYLGLARHRFDKIREYAPDDPDARFGLALAWRYDWLKYLELPSRDEAIAQFRESARLSPRRPDASIMMVPLLVDRKDLDGAAAASAAAIHADPSRLDAILADAYTSYLRGNLAHADSGYRRAIPKLPRSIRARYEDIRPVASPRDTMVLRRLWPQQVAAFTQRFWREQDPDMVSPENEAQLEYWSRVTHAYLLYYDAKRQAWDERGEYYVRYGAPGKSIYNDLDQNLALRLTPGSVYPMNVLTWEYPELGMRVQMQDRMLSGFYLPELKIGLVDNTMSEPEPDPDSLERRPDLMNTGDGRGIFRRVPPGTQLIPVEGAIARFESESGPRVLSGFEVPGDAADSLIATWVVRDSDEVEIARATRALSPSACDPTEFQVADFARDLPPGRYRVGLTVTGNRNRRGVYQAPVELDVPGSGLVVSDLVVACGIPDGDFLDTERPSVRIEPNPAARVRPGEPLTAYFEVAQLRSDADGLAHFELNYTVRSTEKDGRIWIQRLLAPKPIPTPIRTSRSEQQIGSLRRQFVRVPLQSMPVGRYRLEVRIKDLVTGEEQGAGTDFRIEPEPVRSGDAGPSGTGATTAQRRAISPAVPGSSVR